MNTPIIVKKKMATGEEHSIFLCSDLHFGAEGQQLDKLKRDFDKAKRLNADIFIYGDWGEFIIPQDRKRHTSSRDIFQNDNQILDTVDLAYDFLKGYADNIVMIGTGNHEASISKHHSIDPTQALILRLRRECGSKVLHGQYSGFVRYTFGRGENGTSNARSYDIFYTHGQGASSSAGGSINMLKQHVYSKQADCYCAGHTHSPIVVPCDPYIYLNKSNNLNIRKRVAIVTGCYSQQLDQYDALTDGGYRPSFGEERMRTVQGLGGAFLTLTYLEDTIDSEVTI